MCGRLVLLVSLLVLVAACGGGPPSTVAGSASESKVTAVMTEPPSPATTTTVGEIATSAVATSTIAAPASTAASSTSTTVVFQLPGVLRSDGIASVDFGTPSDPALAAIEALLGPADRSEDGWSDCYAAAGEVRILTWDRWGLRLVFTDWSGSWDDPAPAPLHLSDWEVFGPGLTTTAGVGWGSTTSQLRATYPHVLIGINEYAPWFYVEDPAGPLMGALGWEYEEMDAALQEALDERGFETGGQVGEGTGQALLDFMASQGMHGAGDVLRALDLPPADVPIRYLHAGAGPLCD